MHVLEELSARPHADPEPAKETSPSAKSTAERRLEALLDQLPYVILYETGGGREYISNNIEQLLGYTAEELTSERGRFPALIHPSDNLVLEDRLQDWAQRGRPGVFTAQFRIRKRSGEYIWLEDQIIGIENENGAKGMIGVMVDITRRHSAQARYQAIVEAADVAGIGLAILVDREGLPTVLYSNEASHSIGGRSAKEVFNESVLKFVPEDELAKIFEIWNRFRQGQLIQESIEVDVQHKDGRRIPISVGLSSISLDEEPAIIAFMTDITERRRAEQALIEARIAAEEISHIKSNILSNFSHELRTPLHSILGFSSLLVEELPEGDLREYARSVERSGQRLLNTVTSIIEIAQLESGIGELVAYPVQIGDVVEAEALAYK
jgi:PAS domain S-box-containing protein